jgi:hypothetical protein
VRRTVAADGGDDIVNQIVGQAHSEHARDLARELVGNRLADADAGACYDRALAVNAYASASTATTQAQSAA